MSSPARRFWGKLGRIGAASLLGVGLALTSSLPATAETGPSVGVSSTDASTQASPTTGSVPASEAAPTTGASATPTPTTEPGATSPVPTQAPTSTATPTESPATSPTASPSAPPRVRALAAAAGSVCTPGQVLANYPTGQVALVNTVTGAATPVALPGNVGVFSAFAFDISRDGRYVFMVYRDGSAAGQYRVGAWDLQAGTQTSTSAVSTADAYRGGYNPKDGRFYYSSGSELFAYKPGGTAVKVATLPAFVGSNEATPPATFNMTGGDFVFDDAGNLFVVAGTLGFRSALFRVNASDLASATPTGVLPATRLTNLGGVPITTNANGITFGSDGYLYVSNGSVAVSSVWKLDPSTGAAIGNPVTITGGAGLPAGSVGDLGNCVAPSTLTVNKVVAGRAVSTDQFTLQVEGSGGAVAGSATTSGTSTGLQTTGVVGPIIAVPGVSYRLREVAAGSTVLSRYDQQWSCVGSTGTAVPVTQGNPATLTYPQAALSAGAVTCTVTNTPVSATPSLAKQWQFTGPGLPAGTVANGQQPAGISSSISALTRNGESLAAPAWGGALSGFFRGDQLSLTEKVTLAQPYAQCAWRSNATTATVTPGDAPSVNAATDTAVINAVVPAGNSKITVTNTVECSRLTLNKSVQNPNGGQATPATWAAGLYAQRGSDAVQSFDSGQSRYVSPGSYVISEKDVPGYRLKSLVCTGGTLDQGTRTVTVPSGGDVSCTLTNEDIPGTAAWNKADASGTPLAGSEWKLTGPGGTTVTVSDCVAGAAAACTGADKNPAKGAFSLTGLAWGDYTLVETRAPAGFVLDASPRTFTISATHLDQAFAQPFVNQQRDPVSLPLTGGTGSDLFLIGGPVLLGLSAATALWLRRRSTRTAP